VIRTLDQGAGLEVNIRLELRDYVRASQWFLFKNRSIRLLLPFGVLSLVLSAYIWAVTPTNVPWQGLVLPGILLVLWLSPYLNARRTMASNKAIQDEIHYAFLIAA
jgi:hypothetical protein